MEATHTSALALTGRNNQPTILNQWGNARETVFGLRKKPTELFLWWSLLVHVDPRQRTGADNWFLGGFPVCHFACHARQAGVSRPGPLEGQLRRPSPYYTLTPAMAGAGQRSVFSGRRRPAPPAPRDAHRGRTQADARTLFTPTDYTLGHPSPPPRAARACSWCASPVGKSQKMRPQRTMTNGEAPATYKLLRGGTG